mgnify:CR=1 FL=1
MTAAPHVLLVEDNPGDVALLREELAAHLPAGATIEDVGDGELAIAYLCREGRYADRPPTGLVLLDVNLPRLDGPGVLAELGRRGALAGQTIIMLTSSDADADVAASYAAGARGYFRKTANLDALRAVIAAIVALWQAQLGLRGAPR